VKIKPFRIKASKLYKTAFRFMRHVRKGVAEECWFWTGYVCARGYPRFWVEGRSSALAHRVSYALFKGPIKRDKVIDHKCNNIRCVNPEHLQATSQSNNIKAIKRRKK
jgi:hypothetical protein